MSKGNKEEQKWLLGESLNQYDRSLKEELNKVEKRNREQNHKISALINAFDDDYIKKEEENTNISLDYSKEGIVIVDDIKGNTLVNNVKDSNKELVLNGNIDTSGYNNVTLTEGVDGGKVDISLEGNTMVNVCDQEDPIAITKNYEVTTGNHVALQGEYDGKCRPNIYGNTLWIDNDTEEILTTFDGTKSLRLQSSFEDKLITDEKDAHNGKYKVDYKVTGKNKFDGQLYDGWLNNGVIVGSIKYKYSNYIQVSPNTKITLSVAHDLDEYDYNKNYIKTSNVKTIITSLNCHYIRIGVRTTEDMSKFQIEEGDTATTYEPYKESIKTLYLNSPLLEGDTIEQSGNDIVHMHKYKTVTFDGSDDENWSDNGHDNDNNYYRYMYNNIVDGKKNVLTTICDKLPTISKNELKTSISENTSTGKIQIGCTIPKVDEFRTWLQQNPITVVYELATPTKEVISTNDNLLLDSYVNGHLDVDSIVPIDKVVFQSYGTSLKYLSPNTEYTIQFESDSDGKLDALALNSSDVIGNLNIVKGINKFNITTSDEITINYLWTTGIGFNMSKIVVTPKVDGEFGYFKGMKSVGQNDVDGHKIEILSRNKNLITGIKNGVVDNHGKESNHTTTIIPIDYISVENGETYYFSSNFSGYKVVHEYDKDKNFIKYHAIGSRNSYCTLSSKCKYIKFRYEPSNGETLLNTQLQFEKGAVGTAYVEGKSNKKEILMNEPLRGLPNGVRDKYVMIDGKWYIERNNIEIVCNGDENWVYSSPVFKLSTTKYPHEEEDNDLSMGWGICDKYSEIRDIIGSKDYAFKIQSQKIQIRNKDFTDVDSFKSHLNSNPITVVYQLKTPIYEPIDYNPFEVYSDITHISNNSIIPCNMVIKNTGYNCILKPSTLYTIALDTNKSGTIGMNLGGAEGTTSNNVATITTPATLIDNILRLYGKGIKASGVRLLEGDKTNWIPSHFEGMKSCFEDKLQEDGKYKMEILSRNSDESLSNKIQFLLNEPLRAVGDIKDKVYVKEDKIIVQRNCGSVTFDGSDTWNLNKIENNIYTYSIRSTKFLTKMKVGTWETLMNNKCYIIDKCGTATTSTPKNEQLLIHNTVEDKFIWYSTPLFSTVQSVKQYLNDNPFKILYQLETPVYEEIEYSNNRLTLDSYNNSTLFYDSNIPVSNTSFKPLWEELVYVKNSTTYYIQFNAIGNGDVVVNLGGTELSATITEGYNKIEITTPNESTNLLTIDGQGIKISKVVVSEALCSGYYKGLQSCFEEHMENGKYVCVVRGISLDGNKVNGIKFYLNEPLRGIGNTKDRLCIKDNKLMVERNCNSIILNDSDDKTIWIDGASEGCVNTKLYATRPTNHPFGKDNGDMIANNLIVRNIYNTDNIDGMWYRGNAFRIRMFNSKLSTQDLAGFKKYLQQNPITVTYQLATPVYEEITNEYGLPIILEGYENGIVYVDSAVTPTTSIKYTSNNTVPTTLSNVDNLNTTTQDDINNNIVTYMMDIDMMLTEMEMEDNASIMSLSDTDDNNQKHNHSHNNILDRMNKEDRIKYQNNTTKMLEKVIKGKSLTNEENINRIDLYLSEGKIREEQSNYLKELLKGGE